MTPEAFRLERVLEPHREHGPVQPGGLELGNGGREKVGGKSRRGHGGCDERYTAATAVGARGPITCKMLDNDVSLRCARGSESNS
jgi:hypothetical protein